MKNLKKLFPLTSQYTYLNTASSGLMSEKVLDFRHNHDLDYLIQGSLFRDKHLNFINQVRNSVADFFKCKPQRVALVYNFSLGFNILLEGFKPQTKFLLLNDDYPSINWAVKSRGFETNYADISENLEQNILEAIEKYKPNVLALSLVQYINGLRIDFEFLKKLKAHFPNLLIVADGTQYCGTEDFNFIDSGIDILGASAYKWLNAGYGNGFFLFKDDVLERVNPNTIGYNSIQGDHKSESSFIGRFEPGHQDTLLLGSLKTAIEQIKTLGLSNVEGNIKHIQDKAFTAFAERGLLEKIIVNRNTRSPIFNITATDKDFQILRAKGIICSQRGSGIRVSFHYFNTEDDLNALLQVIKH